MTIAEATLLLPKGIPSVVISHFSHPKRERGGRERGGGRERERRREREREKEGESIIRPHFQATLSNVIAWLWLWPRYVSSSWQKPQEGSKRTR